MSLIAVIVKRLGEGTRAQARARTEPQVIEKGAKGKGKGVGEGKGKSAWTPMMIMRPNTDECCMVAFTRLVAQYLVHF